MVNTGNYHYLFCCFLLFLELEAFTETTETFSGVMSQFSSRGDQIPGIGDGEFPVVPAKPEEESVEGLLK